MKKTGWFVVLILASLVLNGCTSQEGDSATGAPKEILVFCGITMIDPVMELAALYEKTHPVSVKLSYGGSQDMAKSIEVNKIGDIYFPGGKKFVDEMAEKGVIAKTRQVGVNQIAFFAYKGNPKTLSDDLNQLVDPGLSVAIGHRDLGSVGRETARILTLKGIYPAVMDNAALIAPDSKGLTAALREKRVDLILNWRSVYFFKDNAQFMEEIPLEPGYAEKHPLVMAQLIYSQNPELTEGFLDLCASDTGKTIFKKFGF